MPKNDPIFHLKTIMDNINATHSTAVQITADSHYEHLVKPWLVSINGALFHGNGVWFIRRGGYFIHSDDNHPIYNTPQGKTAKQILNFPVMGTASPLACFMPEGSPL